MVPGPIIPGAPGVVVAPFYPVPTRRSISMSSLRPLGDRVVVKAIEREEMTSSGIYLPDTAKEKPQEGRIQAVGPGRLLDSGERAPMELKEGDRVIFAKYAGTEFKLDGEDLLILRESDILAVVG